MKPGNRHEVDFVLSNSEAFFRSLIIDY